MEYINVFTSDIKDVRDALKGAWGTEIGEGYKITYLGGIVIAEGDIELLNSKISKTIYEWKDLGNEIHIAWIKK